MSNERIIDFHCQQMQTTGQIRRNSPAPTDQQSGSLEDNSAQQIECCTIAVNSGHFQFNTTNDSSLCSIALGTGWTSGSSTSANSNSNGFASIGTNLFRSLQSTPQTASGVRQPPEQLVPCINLDDNEKEASIAERAKRNESTKRCRKKQKLEVEMKRESLKIAEGNVVVLTQQVKDLIKKSDKDKREIQVLTATLRQASVQAKNDADEKLILEESFKVAADINDDLLKKIASLEDELQLLKGREENLINELVMVDFLFHEQKSFNNSNSSTV